MVLVKKNQFLTTYSLFVRVWQNLRGLNMYNKITCAFVIITTKREVLVFKKTRQLRYSNIFLPFLLIQLSWAFVHSFFFRFTEMIILSVQIKVADVMFHDYILIQASHLMEALVFGPKMNLCHLNVMIMVTKPSNVNANHIKFLIWSMEIGMYPIFQIIYIKCS